MLSLQTVHKIPEPDASSPSRLSSLPLIFQGSESLCPVFHRNPMSFLLKRHVQKAHQWFRPVSEWPFGRHQCTHPGGRSKWSGCMCEAFSQWRASGNVKEQYALQQYTTSYQKMNKTNNNCKCIAKNIDSQLKNFLHTLKWQYLSTTGPTTTDSCILIARFLQNTY